jgi:hypothetical protein
MTGNLWKQPLYRWPHRAFWALMAPLCVVVWLAAIFCFFRAAGRLSLLDLNDALFVLFLNLLVCGLVRYAFRRKSGL